MLTRYYTKGCAKRVCDAVLQGCEEFDVVDILEGKQLLPDLFGLGLSCE